MADQHGRKPSQPLGQPQGQSKEQRASQQPGQQGGQAAAQRQGGTKHPADQPGPQNLEKSAGGQQAKTGERTGKGSR